MRYSPSDAPLEPRALFEDELERTRSVELRPARPPADDRPPAVRVPAAEPLVASS